jgi:lysozyme family protein
MAAISFDQSLKYILEDEGGNDDDPLDHGGRTSRGITQREYDAWCNEHGTPRHDVWTASQSDIRDIYRQEYWQPQCDLLPVGVDYLFFNMAVNGGPYRASVLLQRAVNVVDDGRIGPMTRQAIAKFDAKTLVNNFTMSAERFYRSLHQPRFLKGWLNRNKRVQLRALAMIEGTTK